MFFVSFLHMPHWKENRGAGKRTMKILPHFDTVTRNNEGEAKKEMLQSLGFFLISKKKTKTS